jgi:peptidoglycan hydrolase CwlO-like protein
MAMKEDDQNIQSFVLAKKDESFPTQKEFENNTAISEKTLILYKQISSLNEMVEKLQQKMNPLIQENENLNNEIRELKEKIKPFKPLKAVLKNNPLENNVMTLGHHMTMSMRAPGSQ